MSHAPALRREDYEAIEAAVMETERGRWFLAEFARRNRHADTETVLAALERLERAIAVPREAAPAPAPAPSLDLAPDFAALGQELAAVLERAGEPAGEARALDRLGAMLGEADRDLLDVADRTRGVARRLRGTGAAAAVAEGLAGDLDAVAARQRVLGDMVRRALGLLNRLDGRFGAGPAPARIAAPAIEPAAPEPGPPPRIAHLAFPAEPPLSARPRAQSPFDDVLMDDEEPFEPPPRRAVPPRAAAAAPAAPASSQLPPVRIDFAELSFAEKVALFS